MKKIYYDSIIYRLQRYGGISNYWNELLRGIKRYSEYSNYSSNSDQVRSMSQIETMRSRYCSIEINDQHSIFHSSYYRRCKNKNVKKVVTVYDFMYEKYAHGIRGLIHHEQKGAAINEADLIFCISNNTRQDMEEIFPLSRGKTVIVTHLGVDHEKYYLEKKSEKDIEENVILFVGKRAEYKRFDIAVKLMRELKTYKLGIVGEPLNKYEMYLLNKNIPGRYIQFGKVSDNKLRSLYSQSFCMLFTSEYEGFGLPLLEAQACGCPVVASYTSSLIEIGNGSVKFGNNNNIDSYIESISFLEKEDQRNKIINLGINNSKNYTWNKCINETINAYRNLC